MEKSNDLQHLTTAFSSLNFSDVKVKKDSLLKAVKGHSVISKFSDETLIKNLNIKILNTLNIKNDFKFGNSLGLNKNEVASAINTKTTYAKPPHIPSTPPIFRLFLQPTSVTSKEAGPSFESLLH